MKESMSLILIDNFLYTGDHSTSMAFIFCVIICCFSCIAVVVSAHILHRCTTGISLIKAKIFNVEVYALGLAYCFSLLALSSVCGIHFISQLTQVDDDSNTRSVCSGLSWLYPMIVTYALAIARSMGFFKRSAALMSQADKTEEELEEDELTEQLNKALGGVGDGVSGDIQGGVTALTDVYAEQDANVRMTTTTDTTTNTTNTANTTDTTTTESKQDARYISAGKALYKLCIPVDTLLCSWDEGRITNRSLAVLVFLITGVLCGCAWFTWSVLSLGIVLALPDIIGDGSFALVISYISIEYLTYVSTTHDLDIYKGYTDRMPNSRRNRKEIVILAIRLIVGWSWSWVIIDIITAILAHEHSNPMFYSMRACIRVIVAVIVFYIGRWIDSKHCIFRRQKLEELRETLRYTLSTSTGTGTGTHISVSTSTSQPILKDNSDGIAMNPIIREL